MTERQSCVDMSQIGESWVGMIIISTCLCETNKDIIRSIKTCDCRRSIFARPVVHPPLQQSKSYRRKPYRFIPKHNCLFVSCWGWWWHSLRDKLKVPTGQDSSTNKRIQEHEACRGHPFT